jgi:FkbM family methyltransferase
MAENIDQFWHAAAAHVEATGIAASAVFAAREFATLLPGCRYPGNAEFAAQYDAVILHKGRLGEVPEDVLGAALDNLVASFANEVFVVLTRGGESAPFDNPHLLSRGTLIAEAKAARAARSAEAVGGRPSRMAASYMGRGRVLLETAFGHLMLVDGGDTGIVPHLVRDGWFDRNLTSVIQARLAPGMTFIDIGANFGTYTLIGAEAVGEAGRVIAIDPAPNTAALLFENVLMNGYAARAEVLRCAVGAQEGTATLYQFATHQGGTTLQPHIADAARAIYNEPITPVEVACRTLDAIVAERALARIDLIKIDVEGFEQQALSGARAALAKFRPTLILEWHNDFFKGRKDEAHALHVLLTDDLGYSLHRIEAGGTTRPITRDQLLSLAHSDVVAEPAR